MAGPLFVTGPFSWAGSSSLTGRGPEASGWPWLSLCIFEFLRQPEAQAHRPSSLRALVPAQKWLPFCPCTKFIPTLGPFIPCVPLLGHSAHPSAAGLLTSLQVEAQIGAQTFLAPHVLSVAFPSAWAAPQPGLLAPSPEGRLRGT